MKVSRSEETGGGSPFDEFQGEAESEMTTGERWNQVLDLWVYSPLRVMWSDWRTRIGSAILLVYVLMGTVGVVLLDKPETNEGPRYLPAFQNLQFPLGTDALGNDLLSAIVHATPAMWKMIISGAILATFVGTAVGTLAGYKRGDLDTLLMTITDIVLTIPGLPLLIVLSVALNPRDPFVIGAFLSINAWAGLARSVRSQVLSLRTESYVEASRIMGVSTPRIIVKDILPNIMPYVMINFMGAANRVIYASVGLYFLGVLPWSELNWGVMLNQAQSEGALLSAQAAHWLIEPLFVITMLSFGLILFAQGMDRVFNPRVRARHAKSTGEEGAGPAEGGSGGGTTATVNT